MARRRKANPDAILATVIVAAVVAIFAGSFVLIRHLFAGARYLLTLRFTRPGSKLKLALERSAVLETELATVQQDLQNTLTVLAETDKALFDTAQERDRWRAVAQSQTSRHNEAPKYPPGDVKAKYGKLRAIIIKAIHPDHSGGSPAERQTKEAIFKAVWPEIERLDQ